MMSFLFFFFGLGVSYTYISIPESGYTKERDQKTKVYLFMFRLYIGRTL